MLLGMLSESGSPRIAELFGEGKGRSRRLGVQQRALPQHALGCLDSARDLHRGAGWERALGRRSEPGQSAFFFFFFTPYFLRCLFENTAAQFCCIFGSD